MLLATTLGVAGTAIMLSMFFGQYRWLANQIESASYEEHRSLLESSFERRARADLHAVVDRLPDSLSDSETSTIQQVLNRALTTHPELTGIRLTSSAGETWSSGNYPQAVNLTETTWLEEQLLLTYPVSRDGKTDGVLAGSFQIDILKSDLAAFAAQLQTKENESRRVSYVWIGGGTLAVLLFCFVVVWLATRGQTRRIRQLISQAEKFRDADFGDSLPETSGDELGALASVFNDMRDRLRTTTH